MARGYLSLVLHAHLPYVRPQGQRPDRHEFWYYERARECYLPLIRILDMLQERQVRARVTLSLSPTLIALMRDRVAQDRLAHHLEQMIELSARELNRTALMPGLRRLTGTYHLRLLQMHNAFVQRCGKDMLGAFAEIERRGQIELITCPASHAFLPGLAAMQPQAARCQVRLGIDEFTRAFGHPPGGLWLPECAYSPELDDVLGKSGIRYVIVDGRALEHATPPAVHGIHAPVYCPSGVAAFGRDHHGAQIPGCDTIGRPTDPLYRNNDRDIGLELPLEYLRPYLPVPGMRVRTGIRYHRIAEENSEPTLYDRIPALDRAAECAWDFICERMHRTDCEAWKMDRPPLFVAAHDMHTFGHRWFEGVEFLDYLLRKLHYDQDILETVTPGEYLGRHVWNQMATPAGSSWSRDGYFHDWVSRDTAWVYQHLSRATRVMRRLSAEVGTQAEPPHAGGEGNGNDLSLRALRAAGGQLTLAQSSDWVAMLRDPELRDYGRNRLQLHLSNFSRLASQLGNGEIEAADVEALEREWPIFQEIRPDAYR